jgi:hypothetical protein
MVVFKRLLKTLLNEIKWQKFVKNAERVLIKQLPEKRFTLNLKTIKLANGKKMVVCTSCAKKLLRTGK